MSIASQFAEKVQDLYVLPDSVTRIKSLIDSDSADVDDLAEVIAFDPALSAQLLKLANSALYNFPGKISTVTRAMQVIGTQALYDFVLAYGVSKAFADGPDLPIDTDRFWEQSVVTALMANGITNELSLGDAEQAFLAGILHQIGELVVAAHAPEHAIAIEDSLGSDDYIEQQVRVLGCSYGEISGALAKIWQLPKEICQTVSQHSREPAASESASLLHFCATSARLLVAGTAVIDIEHKVLNMPTAPDLDNDSFRAVMDFVGLETLNLLAIFNPGASTIR